MRAPPEPPGQSFPRGRQDARQDDAGCRVVRQGLHDQASSAEEDPWAPFASGPHPMRVMSARSGRVTVTDMPPPHTPRTILPIPDTPFEGTLPFDARDPDAS